MSIRTFRRSGLVTVLSSLLLVGVIVTHPARVHAQSGDERAFQFAERLYRDGLFELAHEQFGRFAAENPNSRRQGEALLLAADCLIQLERYEASVEAYERVVKRFRQGPIGCEAAFKRASILAELERPRDALRAFDGLKGAYTDCARRYDAELGATEALLELGRPDEALARLADLPADPNRPGMLARTAYIRGRALEDAGEEGNALAAFDAVIQLFPSTIWEDRSHLRRAALLAGEGYHAEALAELQAVGAHGRPEAQALRIRSQDLRASILERLGRHAEAAVAYTESAGLQGEKEAGQELALAGAAAAYERAGDAAGALAVLAQAPSPPIDPVLGLRLAYQQARLAHESGKQTVARAALERLAARAAVDTLSAGGRTLADSLAFEGLMLRVEIAVAAGEPELGGRFLRSWDRSGGGVAARARVDQRLGKLELERLERPLEARAAYRTALEAWEELEQPAPAELWLHLGQVEEALGHHAAARSAYRSVYELWPRHPRAHEAASREAYVRDYLDIDWPAVGPALAALAEEGARTTEPGTALLARLADLDYEQLKNYPAALRLYEELLGLADEAAGVAAAEARATLATGDPAADAAADADAIAAAARRAALSIADLPAMLYRAGRSAILAAHRPGRSPDRRLVERGHRHFSRLVAEFRDHSRADDAQLVLIEAEYGSPERDRRSDRRLGDEAAAYQQFAELFPASDRLAAVSYRLGAIYRDAGMAAGDDSTSYAVARDYFNAVLRTDAESAEAEDASYWGAMMSLMLAERRAASRSFQNYLRLYSRGRWAAECHYQLGELALEDQRLDDARKHYDWIQGQSGDEPLAARALARLGDCELAAEDYAAAREHYEVLLARDPDGPLADQAVLRLAELYERQGDWGQAEAELRRLLADYPDSPRRAAVHLRLGRLRARRGDHRGAADALARYLDSTPEPTAARAAQFERAASLQAIGEGEAALEVYRDLAAESAGDTLALDLHLRARAEVVMLLHDLDREKDARRASERYQAEFPQAAGWLLEIEIARGNFLLRHDPAQARQHFEALLETHGDGDEADRILYGLGLVTMRAAEFEESTRYFERLIRRHPDSNLRYEAHFKLGTAYYTMERYGDAATHYAAAAQRAPDPAAAGNALRNLGLSFERGQRFGDAIRTYRTIAHDHADSPLGLYAAFKIGFAYQEWGKLSQAIAAYREVLPRQTGAEAAETQFWVAECYESADDLETAAAEYLKVGYLYPESGMWAGTGRYRAGGVYEQLGRLEEAEAVYAALAREDPGGEWGGRAAERLRLMSQDPNRD